MKKLILMMALVLSINAAHADGEFERRAVPQMTNPACSDPNSIYYYNYPERQSSKIDSNEEAPMTVAEPTPLLIALLAFLIVGAAYLLNHFKNKNGHI